MTLFFDRNIGVKIPLALLSLRLPVDIKYHQLHFAQQTPDDQWRATVGGWGWFVITQDYKYHLRPNELGALQQYDIGCFYLSGANASKWETMRVFARAYDRILGAALNTPRPFVYRIDKLGRLRSVAIM